MAWAVTRSMTSSKGKGPTIEDFMPHWERESKPKRSAADLEGMLMAMARGHNAALAARKGR